MEFITPQVITTADGSPTLICPSSGDTYHSVNGALAESEHIFIRRGLDLCSGDTISVFEAGFGSGLNAWLTVKRAMEKGCRVEYTAIELYPVDPEVVAGEGFPEDELFDALHTAQWDVPVTINDHFTLTKLRQDLAGTVFDTKFDVVYFDMFAPDTVPHLWAEPIFRCLFDAVKRGGALVTYCAKGDVKRALRAAGFEVRRLPGAPGKRHMLRAEKN